MAADSPMSAEAQWRAQFAAMKAALDELGLAKREATPTSSGSDWDDDVGDFYAGRGKDVWDFISDDDDDGSSHAGSEHSGPESAQHGAEWLAAKCSGVAAKTGMASDVLQSQIRHLLSTKSTEEELQSQLIDLVGFDDIDFAIELLAHRAAITASSQALAPRAVQSQSSGPRLLSRAERQEALRRQDVAHKTAALSPASMKEPSYPHVYKSYHAGNTISHGGQKYGLPVGSERREFETYEEYYVPPGSPGRLAPGQKLVRIDELDGLCRGTFKGYTSLNRMQSLVYPVAYRTSENMLICAPTGAGKTDAAMLTILNTIGQYAAPTPAQDASVDSFSVNTQDFKIVYVAPMKALAAEVTDKLGKRLAWLGIRCREYTGDMQLTKAEILQTQIVVTTPEKWDVVTRKGTGDTELVQKVRLLIIDEVHMLHDERGAVLESLVARTERQVESTQSLIRIVGLSATLPNYVDVADFLRVNRYAGLFYFDASFRPVPLEQRFIGVKGKPNTKASRENLDSVAFAKVKDMLERDHQVMVFVHSRRDTVVTANMLHQKAIDADCTGLLDPAGHPRYEQAERDMRSSRSKEIRGLLQKGLGVHHAGMARADRNLTERLFSEGVIKVLCCTATLAWGVNLPAAAVVIKGTQVYSAQAGKFVDLGILDVLQIFGRAGRPQFEDVGIGMICTTHDKLQHYLSAVTEQQPIESRFSSHMVDNLNAEIALGTVTSIQDAVQWMGYSYLFVRMQRSPLTYGIDWAEIRDDPNLVQRRRKLAVEAARTLQQCQMVVFYERTEELRSKDIGRIASQYYISHKSIELFNKQMHPHATEADIFAMISRSGEFDNVQSRDGESKELAWLRNDVVPCAVEGAIDQPQTKTNILLQAYICRVQPDDFALANDLNYVAQQSGRICRALLMLALNRRWGHQCLVLLTLAKSIEKRIWPFQHPLHQFDLSRSVLDQLDAKQNLGIEALRDMDSSEIGALVRNQAAGRNISRLIRSFPTVAVEAETAPLNRDVLRVRLRITTPDFEWNDRVNGVSESYHVWVENSDTSEMYHHEFFILSRRKLHDVHELNFTIPLSDPLPTQIYVRAVSDRWLGAESVTPVSFQHLIRPDTESVWTPLLSLQPLPVSALKNAALEDVYRQRFDFFNPMQTQIFHTLYHTPSNVLLGSPTGSGKTVAAELAMWWAFRDRPGSKVVYVAPMKALVRERVRDWDKRLARQLGIKLVELTGDNTPDTRTIRDANVIITTPEKWDGISRSWQTRDYVRHVSLVIIDEIHLLAGDRGPILEIIVSRMNYIGSSTKQPVRLLGMSTACANATDLADWLGVKQGGLFNFKHSVRPVPLELYIDGFPAVRGFCPLMQSMNRPTFLAIKNHSPHKPVIVFVPSRRQTRLTAKDLINFCGMEDNPRRFLSMDDEDEDGLQAILSRAKDEALCEALNFGIGLHHAGLVESDRQLAEELFLAGKIQILIATSTLAWGVNLPAHLVVVKGTQFYDAKTEAYKDMDLTDVLQMLGRAGRPQFDSSGVARIFTQDAKKDYYKHFLHTGFPVESSLHKVLDNHLCAEISAGTIKSKQDALDYLTWTFFFRRLHKNPSYYGLELPVRGGGDQATSSGTTSTAEAQNLANEYMVGLVDKSLADLEESRCVEVFSNGETDATPLGRIMSYYYLSHLTVRGLVRSATAKPVASFADALGWMCRAAEYDELPVRHNEDLVNAELSRALPLPATAFGLPMWDPHVKAFLLLQAHMARVELPISDYVGDQTSVLDQAIRIVQAGIDVLAELGHVQSCIEMVRVLQSVKSARWPTDAAASILPGVSPDWPDSKPECRLSLADVAQAASAAKQLGSLAAKLSVAPDTRKTFAAAASSLPRMDVTVASAAGRLSVDITRLNQLTQRDARAYTPRFPKAQTEGWFVMVLGPPGEDGQEEMLAMKRAGWAVGGGRRLDVGAKPEARATVRLPPAWHGGKVDVLVMSDCYPGLEKRVEAIAIDKQ